MMTRTLGTVSGAALLMLAFQAGRDGAALEGDAALVAGFRLAFLLAAGVAAGAGALLVWRAPR